MLTFLNIIIELIIRTVDVTMGAFGLCGIGVRLWVPLTCMTLTYDYGCLWPVWLRRTDWFDHDRNYDLSVPLAKGFVQDRNYELYDLTMKS